MYIFTAGGKSVEGHLSTITDKTLENVNKGKDLVLVVYACSLYKEKKMDSKHIWKSRFLKYSLLIHPPEVPIKCYI